MNAAQDFQVLLLKSTLPPAKGNPPGLGDLYVLHVQLLSQLKAQPGRSRGRQRPLHRVSRCCRLSRLCLTVCVLSTPPKHS